ncbi:uncharacterized protein LOC131155400 [Malania oleifera]|uniref:uncharacterized protein LOC131155400 n=1 Tax=Malania oleifera TaxID=397392 RepID=UPI0025AE28AB|nr:uncharacterized protein LOC131155400 [Malania oleifera]
METLVVLAQHRNQYYSRSKANEPARFGSSPSRNFREISCRTFQSGTGILPTPLRGCTTPVAKRACPNTPKTLSPCAKFHSDDSKHLTVKTTSLPIDIEVSNKQKSFNDNFCYSELWAGPAYSNSPPPSSLPIPKFSLQPKRTLSLDMPGSAPVVKMHPTAKSAPPSPTREPLTSPKDLFLSVDSATKTLRRILNLDTTDE